MPKKVLIVILVYNGADYLSDCLSSLSNISYPVDQYEILVVDNHSADNSVEYVKTNWPKVKVISNQENLGFAAGNNIGFNYAIDNGFSYVYLLNQDTVVVPNFLEQAIKLAKTDFGIGAVQSKLLLDDDKTKINSIGNEIHYLGFGFAGGHKTSDQGIVDREITYPSGAASLWSVGALKEVGLFNEELFMYHEDLDLGWRLRLAGYKVMLAAQSIVYHKYEFSRSIKKFYFMERNRYLVMLQNYKWQTILLIGPACGVMDLVMFGYSFFAGWWQENLRVWAYFCRLKSWRKMIKTRRIVQSKRKVSDYEVIKRFTGKIEFQDLNNPLLTKIVNPIFDWYWQMAKKVIRW